ncbi:OmpA family protein [Pseudozobellia thermophila]|uniref:OmpA family protein n=1 Tax=Pseudozobellia thermophila TaxID=192903 RepID=A0A1M6NIB5_9FLAO|nr:OmpA family protein [Pseudozobellia thermophila]SHJ95420.1 OmpA family protein [Pseudozobellia thermophila]
MKRIMYVLQLSFTLLFVFISAPEANGQLLKKLGKAAERAAERTVERRVEKETSEKTDQALDSIFEPGSKGSGKKKKTVSKSKSPQPSSPENNGSGVGNKDQVSQSQNGTAPIGIYSKFDFVPGDEPLFLDDFSNDFVGDFPSRWNTNGSGELVTVEGETNKWLKILPGYDMAYIPDISPLPDEFTLEFDVIAIGLDDKTSSQSNFGIVVSDNNTFEQSANMGMVEYSFCQFIDPGVIVENRIASKRVIRNDVKANIRDVVKEKHHISVAVNKERFRFWINEKKYIDVPRLLPSNVQMQGIKFTLRGTDTTKESILIGNVKVAKGGVDLRRKLLADGRISTTGILFDSGSAQIQPQSMGIIRQIYQVLQQDDSINLKIVGHTDADGDDAKNLELSKNRAEAVKNALVSIYKVSPNRLTTEGKGETQPVGDNATTDGKALNRRVEFIKL